MTVTTAEVKPRTELATTTNVAISAQPKLAIDGAAVRRYLSRLDPDAERFTLATLGDSDERKADRKKQGRTKSKEHDGAIWKIPGRVDPIHHYGTIDELLPIMQRSAEVGDGCFVAIHEGPATGERSNEVMIRPRAIVLDFDAKHGQALPSEWPLQPSLINESSPCSHHVYWLIDGETPWDLWHRLQDGVIAHFGSDRAVRDRARVLRVPGTYHLKGKPFLVREVEGSGDRQYTAAELEEAFGLLAPKPLDAQIQLPTKSRGLSISQRAMRTVAPEYEADDIEEALRKYSECLAMMHPDQLGWGRDDYNPWLLTGTAGHHATGGDKRALEIWDRWSQQGRKYDAGECRKRWKGFATNRTDKTNLGSLINLVRQTIRKQDWCPSKKPVTISVAGIDSMTSSWGWL